MCRSQVRLRNPPAAPAASSGAVTRAGGRRKHSHLWAGSPSSSSPCWRLTHRLDCALAPVQPGRLPALRAGARAGVPDRVRDREGAFRRLVPSVPEYRGSRFTVVEAGKRRATPLLLVLSAVELTDIAFAVDSIHPPSSAFPRTRSSSIPRTSSRFSGFGRCTSSSPG
jgi:hypothetical protein